ncbi:hypothetical protein PVAP13_8KG350910 [Panicum virgatum]|uniref:Uncharacterized protein n=1 Tax=Panicum virgatum TaxID=38727 RepID=A0A8T0PM35_PANVG|nr:hypothetical protein PVAP13_8KG350910 [Panicum virgatum]
MACCRKVFKTVHSRSIRVDIYDMPTVFGSVSNQTNHNDSGVFVLQLLLAYDGKTHFHFKEEHAKPLRESITYYLCIHEENEFFEPPVHQQEHAKPLRESITYYLCIHEENELIMPEIKDITRQHHKQKVTVHLHGNQGKSFFVSCKIFSSFF